MTALGTCCVNDLMPDTYDMTLLFSPSLLQVLARMNSLVKNWIRDLSIEKNMPANLAETVGGNVYTFGSYR
jgi:poly(A) polymerase Pap1